MKANDLHSPFVFEFYTQVVHAADKHYYVFEQLEELRQYLAHSQEVLQVKDLGAGSQKLFTSERSVSNMLKYSASSVKTSKLLFRLVDYFKPKTILELGTHLGVGTQYLAAAAPPRAKIVTVEGCPSTSKFAQAHYPKDWTTVNFLVGDISSTLPSVLEELQTIDFVFIDAHHTAQALQKCFSLLLPHLTARSVLVVDDIRWSEDMYDGWLKLTQHPAVTVSMDLLKFGILSFRTEQPKQDFTLFYWPY